MDINQNITIENRKSVLITGVNSVKSFDSKEFILDTKLGILEINGKELVLGKMDLNNGEVLIKGSIESLEYSLKDGKKESLVKRLFKWVLKSKFNWWLCQFCLDSFLWLFIVFLMNYFIKIDLE